MSSQRGRMLLMVAALAVLVSRLPFIGIDYGSDADAFRVARVAADLATEGRYRVSRFPGYPVQEIASSLLVRFGPVGTNAATAVMSVVAFVALALALHWLPAVDALLVALAFAATPVIFVNSTATMDYMWALAFILLSLLNVVRARPAVAGIFLGVAIGCRITSGAMLLPLALHMVWSVGRLSVVSSVLSFTAVTLAVGAVCFAPVPRRYGMEFVTFYDFNSYPPLRTVLERATMEVWGVIGCAGLAGVAGAYLFQKARRTSVASESDGASRRAISVCAVLAIGLYVMAYARLPMEAGYLIPVVPFVLILLALYLPRPLLRVACVTLLAAPIVTVGRHGVTLDGPILQDHWNRQHRTQLARALVETVRSFDRKSLVVCGWELPRVKWVAGAGEIGDSRFVELIVNEQQYEDFVGQGYVVFFLPRMDRYNLEAYGVNLAEMGARKLEIEVPGG